MSGLEITLLAGIGLFAGIFGTMTGIGGGVLFVPVFLLVFHFTPQEAIGTSLVAVFFNALSGSISYLRQKRVDIRAGWKFAVATIPGAFFGAWLARFFTSHTLELVFGFLLMALAIFVFLRREPANRELLRNEKTRKLTDFRNIVFEYNPREVPGIAISFAVGFISSLLGIGGGVIHVPVLIYLLGFPIHIAVATSLFVLAISTLTGSITHLTMGHIQFVPAVIAAASAMVGAQAGALVARRINGLFIARLLASALLLGGIRMLLKTFGVV